MFADDLKIFLEIRNVNDCHQLQSDLGALSVLATKTGLDFHISKCHSMFFYRIRDLIVFNYNNSNKAILKYLFLQLVVLTLKLNRFINSGHFIVLISNLYKNFKFNIFDRLCKEIIVKTICLHDCNWNLDS